MTKFLELIRPKGGLIVLAAMLPDGGAPNVMTYELPGEIGEAVALDEQDGLLARPRV
jgi:hypothetical protein